MGKHDQDQRREPARPPLTTAQAQKVTAGLREAMDDVRRSVTVLAARVRDAHAARVWVPLGHSSWASYCAAEFGINRAQAYRLLDVARALAAIHGAGAAGGDQRRRLDEGPRGQPPGRRLRPRRPARPDEQKGKTAPRKTSRSAAASKTAKTPARKAPPKKAGVASARARDRGGKSELQKLSKAQLPQSGQSFQVRRHRTYL
ncbi:hypothetical protein [Streptomyces sp. NPDC056821]|uniref:hypothetical protein n=1 Tax=unclassified Streptomyces TaxID=2593676 RepID=UPI0036861599